MAPMPVSEAITLGILGALITVENVLVCYLVYRYRFLRTFTNGFVVSLALSDVLFGCVLLPMNIVDLDNQFNHYLASIILFANVTNLLAVTWDRYLAVLHPLLYTYNMSKYFVKVLVAAWAVPIPISILPLAWNNNDPRRVESTVYLFFIVIGGVILPYISILVVYILIFREVACQVKKIVKLQRYTDNFQEATAERKRVSGEARVARVFAVIAGIFVVSWGPVIYMTAAAALQKTYPGVVSVIAWYTMSIGSLANAAMYAFFKADFRRAFVKLFRCHANTASGLRCSYAKSTGASTRSTSV